MEESSPDKSKDGIFEIRPTIRHKASAAYADKDGSMKKVSGFMKSVPWTFRGLSCWIALLGVFRKLDRTEKILVWTSGVV